MIRKLYLNLSGWKLVGNFLYLWRAFSENRVDFRKFEIIGKSTGIDTLFKQVRNMVSYMTSSITFHTLY